MVLFKARGCTTASRSRRAFSLIEMAVVIGLIGIIAGYMLMTTNASKNTNCYVETKDKIARVQEAVERYAMSKDKFPMPARRNVGVESDQYGREVALADIGDLDEKANADGDVAVFGAVPFQALGISVENAVDCWGNKLTYVVTKGLTDPTKFLIPETNGAMDVNSNSGVLHLKGAGYAIISHGADELGAVKNNYSGADTDHKWCKIDGANPVIMRNENCETTNTILMAAQFNDGKDGGDKFFDDVIAYRGKPWRKGVTGPEPGDLYMWGEVSKGNGHTYTPYGQGAHQDESGVPVPVETKGILALATYNSLPAGWYSPGKQQKFIDATVSTGSQNGSRQMCAIGDAITNKPAVNTPSWGLGPNPTTGVTVNVPKGNLYCWTSDPTAYPNQYVAMNGRIPNRTATSATQAPQDPIWGPGAMFNGVLSNIVSVGLGHMHGCALNSAGTIYCWGYNNYGQLGDGTTSNPPSPPAATSPTLTHVPDPKPIVAPGLTFTQLAVGAAHNCALATDNKVYCWGRNDWGQVGNGAAVGYPSAYTNLPAPVLMSGVPGFVHFTNISAGGYSCALGSNGVAYCWGAQSTLGELGRQFYSLQSIPAAVKMPGSVTFTSISVGGNHACAMGIDNQAYCWGASDYGQAAKEVVFDCGIGDFDTGPHYIPYPKKVDIAMTHPGVNPTSISTGMRHTCALGNNKKVYCWGDDAWGQLGDGNVLTKNCTNYPRLVSGGFTFDHVQARGRSTMAW